jgi:hypothetical protein
MSNKRTKIFLDTEFTGLHQNTSLISIALVSGNKSFYAEITDYDESQVDSWLQENVIKNLFLNTTEHGLTASSTWGEDDWRFKGKKINVAIILRNWIEQFEEIEIWSDCLAYDWVLFCELFGGAMKIPKNVFYIPFDICTLFLEKGIDPDISRESFVEPIGQVNKHNALYDALIIESCYSKLNSL